jgi:hypothetical protein
MAVWGEFQAGGTSAVWRYVQVPPIRLGFMTAARRSV